MEICIISYNIEGITLEKNYCKDQSLKNYIINKSEYLKKYLPELDADIICIQEYTPILLLELEDYYCVKENTNAIFFRKNKFIYIDHVINQTIGLFVILKTNNIIIEIGTHRFPPYSENCNVRRKILKKLDKKAKNKLLIFAADTNTRDFEEYELDNLTDCFHGAYIREGCFTLDKTTNPYFFGANCNKNKNKKRTRYDKIYYTNFFKCQKIKVIEPKADNNLIHSIYPYGNISDHYPLMANLVIVIKE